MMENVRNDPLSIALVGVTFTLASKKNLKELVRKNEEKDERIREMEEEVKRTKRDKESIREFKLCMQRICM